MRDWEQVQEVYWKGAIRPLSEFSDYVLGCYYLNARTTYYGALGHGKADSCASMMSLWRGELERRNLDVPTEGGSFNGPGSG